AFRGDGTPVGRNKVAPCEQITVQMSVVYIPFDPITGGRAAAFQDGAMFLTVGASLFTTNVTPAGGIPLIGGDGSAGCNGSNFLASRRIPYTVTVADLAAGQVRITAAYTNGTAHLGDGELPGVVSGTQGF